MNKNRWVNLVWCWCCLLAAHHFLAGLRSSADGVRGKSYIVQAGSLEESSALVEQAGGSCHPQARDHPRGGRAIDPVPGRPAEDARMSRFTATNW